MKKTKEKSFPVMQSICFWCGELKDEILIGKRATAVDTHKDKVISDYSPCSSCKDNMNKGITFIEMSESPIHDNQPMMFDRGYPTHRWAVLKEEAVSRMIEDQDIIKDILEKRKTFVDVEAFSMLFGERNKTHEGE